MYGQTEAAARLAYLPGSELQQKPNSIGKPIPHVQLQVQSEDGRPVPCGEIGELCARGRNVMLGYWKDKAATARVLKHGWLRTGDLATVDKDGFYYLKGRRDSQVKIRGMKVSTGAIADTISRLLPDCQVVVLPFSQNDLPRLALFVAQDGYSADLPARIRRICRETLAPHELPSFIEVVDRFPLTDSLKIDLPSLSNRAKRQLQSQGAAALLAAS
jgi:acyl-CoA synthetase (AMP-forming)/AMP-acid ligase II